jgi:hypothetical protein
MTPGWQKMSEVGRLRMKLQFYQRLGRQRQTAAL